MESSSDGRIASGSTPDCAQTLSSEVMHRAPIRFRTMRARLRDMYVVKKSAGGTGSTPYQRLRVRQLKRSCTPISRPRSMYRSAFVPRRASIGSWQKTVAALPRVLDACGEAGLRVVAA